MSSVVQAKALEKSIRAQAKRDGVTHIATGVAVFRDRKVLLVRRAAHDSFGGMYELPGGGVDEGETIAEGASRELKEETGLIVTEVLDVCGGYDYASDTKPHARLVIFYVAARLDDIVLDPNEHDDFKWVDDNTIEDLDMSANMKQSVKAVLSFRKAQKAD